MFEWLGRELVGTVAHGLPGVRRGGDAHPRPVLHHARRRRAGRAGGRLRRRRSLAADRGLLRGVPADDRLRPARRPQAPAQGPGGTAHQHRPPDRRIRPGHGSRQRDRRAWSRSAATSGAPAPKQGCCTPASARWSAPSKAPPPSWHRSRKQPSSNVRHTIRFPAAATGGGHAAGHRRRHSKTT